MKIKVDLSRSGSGGGYEILIGSGIISHEPKGEITDILNSVGLKGRVFVIMSKTVSDLYGGLITHFFENADINPIIIILPDGENTKSQKYLSLIYDELINGKAERRDFIIAFGGGVVGDLAGFAAATYLRGINFIQMPTTLLADVDSSVGGKTGINHSKGKNLIGAFYQPKVVLIDTGLLKSLDARELANGFAEVIKYGAVLDGEFFSYLENNYDKVLSYDESALAYIIERSCTIKADIVSEDEKEAGIRSVLNFGHSMGHAVEALHNYENIKHGEAISIGMVFAAMLSKKIGLCTDETVTRVKNLIEKSGLPVKIPEFTAEQYINAMKLDKKVSKKQIKFVLIEGIGNYKLKKLDFGFIHDYILDICTKTVSR